MSEKSVYIYVTSIFSIEKLRSLLTKWGKRDTIVNAKKYKRYYL